MFYFLIVVILLIALLMGLVVLLQSGKGGGLAGIAAGGQTTQILGARQAPDFLEKATWTLGWTFLALCVLTTFFIPRADRGGSILQDRADELPAGAPAPIEAPAEAPPAGDAVPLEAAPSGDAPSE
ncbi:MAG: preprotein translocase subunit SecG [Bacteroidota bacterium]